MSETESNSFIIEVQCEMKKEFIIQANQIHC